MLKLLLLAASSFAAPHEIRGTPWTMDEPAGFKRVVKAKTPYPVYDWEKGSGQSKVLITVGAAGSPCAEGKKIMTRSESKHRGVGLYRGTCSAAKSSPTGGALFYFLNPNEFIMLDNPQSPQGAPWKVRGAWTWIQVIGEAKARSKAKPAIDALVKSLRPTSSAGAQSGEQAPGDRPGVSAERYDINADSDGKIPLLR